MQISQGLASLIAPPQGKMRQISSQGRQEPPELMAKAIGDAPGKSVQIAPGETYTVAEIEGAGTILRIWMTTMQPMPGLPHNFNHSLVLRFFWDGEETPSVEVPFGDFYGVPWGKYTHYLAEPLSCTSGGYNCQFPMPFSRSCRIEVVNQAPGPCPAFFFQVQYLELDEQPSPLRFHAQWRRENPTRYGVPYRVLEATGSRALCRDASVDAEIWLVARPGADAGPRPGNRQPRERHLPRSRRHGDAGGLGEHLRGRRGDPFHPRHRQRGLLQQRLLFQQRALQRAALGLHRAQLPDLALRRLPLPHQRPDPLPAIDRGRHGPRLHQPGRRPTTAAWPTGTRPSRTLRFPALPPLAERLPTPTGQNALQIALVASPAWIPATLVGLKALSKFVRGRK